MKARFKIKLNQDELEAMYFITKYMCATVKNGDVALVPMYDLTSNLATRLVNMYKPEKNEYTLRLSSVEAYVLMNRLTNPAVVFVVDGNPFEANLVRRLGDELQRQFDHELSSVNAIFNHKPYTVKFYDTCPITE